MRMRARVCACVCVCVYIYNFITNCCLSHLVFDQVNLWPAWVGFETAIV